MTAWLTQLTIDHRAPGVHGLLTRGDRLHEYVMHLVPGELGATPRQTAGVLFRVEDSTAATRILVQTGLEPAVEKLPGGYVTSAAVRRLDTLLAHIEAGRRFRYRITANPTKRWGNSNPDPDARGKLHVLRGAHAEQWWLDRAAGCGLGVESTTWQSLPDIVIGGRARHAAARFDGIATVVDAAAVRDAVASGIGRARSYGCGLLSLGPIGGVV